MLSSIISPVQSAVTFMGAVFIVYGAVNFGIAQTDPSGGQISSAIKWIAGGAIIIAAASFFGSLPSINGI